MTEELPDRTLRMYADRLLRCSGVAYSARDIATLAAVIPWLEKDIAQWIGENEQFSVLTDRIEDGTWRSPYKDSGQSLEPTQKGEG